MVRWWEKISGRDWKKSDIVSRVSRVDEEYNEKKISAIQKHATGVDERWWEKKGGEGNLKVRKKHEKKIVLETKTNLIDRGWWSDDDRTD